MTPNRLGSRLLAVVGLVSTAALTSIATSSSAGAAGRLCGPPADTVPPQVSDLTLSPATVDVTDGPATVTVTVDATDTAAGGSGSGVKRVRVSARGPHGYASARLSRVSGDADDGEWQGTLTIPQSARTGTWSIEDVDTQDAARNNQYYSHYRKSPASPTDLALQTGWDQSFTVTNSSPVPPTVKPGRLSAFKFTPRSVNTAHRSRKVRVSAAFTKPRPAAVNVSFFGTARRGPGSFQRATLTQGAHGRWTGQLTVHRWAGNVTAQAQIFAEYGTAVKPRFRNLSATDLAARHLPSVLKITSGVDSTKPVLKGLTISPSSVNTTSGPQTVDVTASVTDSQSGVKRVEASFFHRGRPGGYASVRLRRHGTSWTGQATIRQCVSPGSWQIDLETSDAAGNFASYRSKTLAAAGLPSQLAVTSTPGDIAEPTVSNATASALDHSITLDFSEGVKNVTTSTLTVYAMQPASSRYTMPLTIPSITCSDGTSVVDCSGGSGLVSSAILQAPDVSGGQAYQVWANLDSVTSQLTDAAGNPLDWSNDAAEVTGS